MGSLSDYIESYLKLLLDNGPMIAWRFKGVSSLRGFDALRRR